jgi:hypothetical protein
MTTKILTLAFILISQDIGFATTTSECKPKIDKARSSLIDMLSGKKDDIQKKLVTITASEATECINNLKMSGKDADIKDLQKVWADFKATRETQLVPAILAGKTGEAKIIATGIQKERMDKINALIKKIQGGDL